MREYDFEIERLRGLVTGLTTERDEAGKMVDKLVFAFNDKNNECRRLESEAAALRSALEWYADQRNYPASWSEHHGAVAEDGGVTANTALTSTTAGAELLERVRGLEAVARTGQALQDVWARWNGGKFEKAYDDWVITLVQHQEALAALNQSTEGIKGIKGIKDQGGG